MFFNGNTFASIGRQLAIALFNDLPALRLREISSATAHYIAGVLDRDSMTEIVETLCAASELVPGTPVRTLRGSSQGIVVRVLEDGRVTWRTEAGTELTALPESLVKRDE